MAQTPSTWADYVGDGVGDTFQVTFPYQKQQEVFVTVDGAPAAFTFISAGWVQLAAAPASGAAIRVQRSTEAFEPRHEFANGVPLLPRFIDENNKQFLYAVQEAVNETAGVAADALSTAAAAVGIAQAASDKVDAAVIDSALILRADLANSTDPEKGTGAVSYNAALEYPVGSLGEAVRQASLGTGNTAIPVFTPKAKPSRQKAISETMAVEKQPHFRNGDGRIGVGSVVSDFSFETAINSLGGTEGTRTISMRIGVGGYNKTGGAISFQVQLDPAYYLGASPRVFTHADPAFPTIGLVARGTLTHSGGGLYTISVTPAAGWEDYIGVDLRLTPVNSTNDATLHQEYWALKRITAMQGASTVIDTNDTHSGVFVSQLVPRNTGVAFSPATVVTDTRTYHLNYARFMSGGTYNYTWVSPDGSASGYGPEYDPVNIKRARDLCITGQIDTFFLMPGRYVYPGVRNRDVFNFVRNLNVVCPNGVAVVDCGFSVSTAVMSAVGGHYEFSYDPVNNSVAEQIATGAMTPAIIADFFPPVHFAEVASSALVDTTPRSYWWDNANQKFLVNFGGAPQPLLVPEALSLVKSPVMGGGSARMINVKIRGARDNVGVFINCDRYESYGCGGPTARGDGYRVENTPGFNVDDDCTGAGADGFNYHGNQNQDAFDCTADYCYDDGISHHDNCTGVIQGGKYRFNGKAGVIPAFGASVVAYRVNTEGNSIGSHPNANAQNTGGLVALSYAEGFPGVNSYTGGPWKGASLIAIECESSGSERAIVSSGGASEVMEYKCTSTDAVKLYGAGTSSTGIGEIRTFNSSPGEVSSSGVVQFLN